MKPTSQYRAEFTEALERARRIGLSVPELPDPPPDRVFLGGVRRRAVRELLEKTYRPHQLPGACLQATFDLQDQVAAIAGVPAYFTVGAVTYLGEECFSFEEAAAREWVEQASLGRRPAQVHVWITLATMEIVDLTYAYTLRHVAPGIPGIGNPKPIVGSCEQLTEWGYRPLVVATDFVERTGAIVGVALVPRP